MYKTVSYPTEMYCNHWLAKCLFTMWRWNNWLLVGGEELNEGLSPIRSLTKIALKMIENVAV